MSSPQQRTQAWFFAFVSLLLISLVAAGSYFAYDCVGPLAPLLKAQLGLSSEQIGWLYSVYSIPVIVLVLFGGMLADRLGVRKAGLLFTVIFVAGTVLTATGIYPVMIGGRLLFGIGCECVYIVMNKVIAKWFKDKTLALAFGLNLLLCRAGTYAAFFGLPWLAGELASWQLTLWVIAAITGVSLVAMLLYCLVDAFGDARGFTAIVETAEKFEVRDVLRLPRAFWILAVQCAVYYSAIFPFTAFSTDYFVERYGLPDLEASRLSGVIILISMLTTWLFGLILDLTGKRTTMILIGALLLVPCHVSMGYTQVDPWIPIIVMGVSFAAVPAAIWPAVAVIVRENQTGTAYGAMSMVQNVGLFIFPVAVGAIRDWAGSYDPAMILFSSLAAVGVISALWLKLEERRCGLPLDRKLRKAGT